VVLLGNLGSFWGSLCQFAAPLTADRSVDTLRVNGMNGRALLWIFNCQTTRDAEHPRAVADGHACSRDKYGMGVNNTLRILLRMQGKIVVTDVLRGIVSVQEHLAGRQAVACA
jgi:hypothetical protein